MNVDLVIFEDLDRLESLKIFVKLRELNTIINNSPRKAKKVTFIYAVKDSMFKNENERAKFFEFILPIIPVMNPVTTFDNIDKMHKQQLKVDASLKLSEQFLKDISFYVSDMRVLKNTFNDYVIMANKLSDNSDKKLPVKKENLFALALYKNLYPYDYSRLQKNEGLIPLCIKKDELIEFYKKDIENKIIKLEKEKERINAEYLKGFNELRLIFIGQHFECSPESIRGTIKNINEISTFENVKYIRHPNPNYYGYVVHLHNLPDGETYYEREKIIKGKINDRLAVIEKEFRECKSDIEDLEGKTFNSLLNEYGIENYFSVENVLKIKESYKITVNNGLCKDLDAQFDFIRMLICKNYLDENYLEYTSNNKSDLSLNDREFIRNVKQGFVKTYNYKLDNVKAVIRNLNEEDFLQPAILVKDMLLSLTDIQDIDSENVIKTNKFNKIMDLLATGSKLVVIAVVEFLAVADRRDEGGEKFEFAMHIAQYAPGLVEPLFLKGINDSDKDIFLNALISFKKYDILKQKVIKTYIEEHQAYLNIFEDIEPNEIIEAIKVINLNFKFIDLSNEKDEVYKFVVDGGYYRLTVDNLKIILYITDGNIFDFEQKNYSYIMDSGNIKLIEKIKDNLEDYLNNVYTKLSNSKESESVFKAFILDEKLNNNIKIKLIHNSQIEIENLNNVEEQLFETLLLENKIVASWENVFKIYKTKKYNEALSNFIIANDGKVSGSFYEQDRNIQVEIFDYFLSLNLNELVYANLAKSLDVLFAMSSKYAKNKNCEQFVLNKRFNYSVGDMAYLSNTPNMFPYLVCYQDKILAEMGRFFNGHTFKASYMNSIIDNDNLSTDFKKEFIYVCGGALVEIDGIEENFAQFIIDNNCRFTEILLYKFVGAKIDEPLKIGLLSLAVKQNIITDLNSFKKYFQSISDDFAELWEEAKTVIEDNAKTRSIAEYMKDKKMITYTPRKGKLYLRCS